MMSNSLATTPAMNNLHQNTTYYPLQVFYYPAGHVSPSLYLSPGHVHTGPVTFLLRGKQ